MDALRWDTAQRNFLLEKDGSVFLVVKLGQADPQGPTTTPTVSSRSGRLPQPDIRSTGLPDAPNP